MPRAGVSEFQVAKIATELFREHKKPPTVREVHKKTGGSMTTISTHLAIWKEKNLPVLNHASAEYGDVVFTALVVAHEALNAKAQGIVDEASAAFLQAEETLRSEIGDLRAQNRTLTENLSETESSLKGSHEREQRLKAEVDTLSSKLAKAEESDRTNRALLAEKDTQIKALSSDCARRETTEKLHIKTIATREAEIHTLSDDRATLKLTITNLQQKVDAGNALAENYQLELKEAKNLINERGNRIDELHAKSVQDERNSLLALDKAMDTIKQITTQLEDQKTLTSSANAERKATSENLKTIEARLVKSESRQDWYQSKVDILEKQLATMTAIPSKKTKTPTKGKQADE